MGGGAQSCALIPGANALSHTHTSGLNDYVSCAHGFIYLGSGPSYGRRAGKKRSDSHRIDVAMCGVDWERESGAGWSTNILANTLQSVGGEGGWGVAEGVPGPACAGGKVFT